MPGDLSVVICTHNPNLITLDSVLESINSQSLPAGRIEVVVVDNASDSRVDHDRVKNHVASAKVVVEGAVGLTNARLRGIRESSAELLLFVDDDNVLRENYCSEGLRIGSEWPMLGAWGGQLLGVHKGYSPSPRARRIWDGSFTRDCWSNQYARNCAPSGGGMFLRRSVAEFYCNEIVGCPIRRGLGRRGTGLSASEDIDMAYGACDIGLGIAKFQCLVIDHLIPEGRCDDSYLDRLMEGIGYSETLLKYARGGDVFQKSRVDRLTDLYKRIRARGVRDRDEYCVDQGRRRAVAEIVKNEVRC